MSDVEVLRATTVSEKQGPSEQRGWTDVDAFVREAGRYGG